MRFQEICRVNESYKIFADWGQGWKYLVLAGKGKIKDLAYEDILEIKKLLEPEERKKLENYIGE
ncbi:MAG: hypothetical protein QW286_02000 [Candidatus Aenigmatarchaeota archaeon]